VGYLKPRVFQPSLLKGWIRTRSLSEKYVILLA